MDQTTHNKVAVASQTVDRYGIAPIIVPVNDPELPGLPGHGVSTRKWALGSWSAIMIQLREALRVMAAHRENLVIAARAEGFTAAEARRQIREAAAVAEALDGAISVSRLFCLEPDAIISGQLDAVRNPDEEDEAWWTRPLVDLPYPAIWVSSTVRMDYRVAPGGGELVLRYQGERPYPTEKGDSMLPGFVGMGPDYYLPGGEADERTLDVTGLGILVLETGYAWAVDLVQFLGDGDGGVLAIVPLWHPDGAPEAVGLGRVWRRLVRRICAVGTTIVEGRRRPLRRERFGRLTRRRARRVTRRAPPEAYHVVDLRWSERQDQPSERPAGPSEGHSYRYDVRGHPVLRRRQGRGPIPPEDRAWFERRGYTVYRAEDEQSEEMGEVLAMRGVSLPTGDGWLACKVSWREAHVRPKDPTLPYRPRILSASADVLDGPPDKGGQ